MITFLAYLITKNIDINNEVIQRIAPKPIIIPWLTSIPSGSADTAAPTANGLTVDPRTPEPAPSNTTADATSVSIPAATIATANIA